jgi:hypothetical protein
MFKKSKFKTEPRKKLGTESPIIKKGTGYFFVVIIEGTNFIPAIFLFPHL